MAISWLKGRTRGSNTAATTPPSNPFFTASTLPFQAPPFDQIKDTDYQPAIEEGMRQELAEIETIANSSEPPTFDNTIEAMERTGDAADARVQGLLRRSTQSNTNDTLQKVQAEEAPKLAAHQRRDLPRTRSSSRASKALYDQRATLGLDAEAKYLVERYYRNFVRAGAQLSDADKATLRALNQEESKLTHAVPRPASSPTPNASARRRRRQGRARRPAATPTSPPRPSAAKERKLDGKWVLTLQNTTQQPALASLKNRALRERLFNASVAARQSRRRRTTRTRSSPASPSSARSSAKLLGYPTYAAYVARRPDGEDARRTRIKLMTDLVPAATAQGARRSGADAEAHRRAERRLHSSRRGTGSTTPSRCARPSTTSTSRRSSRTSSSIACCSDGVFFAANQLYGLTFKERKDIPVYQPDVRVFEVFDADGTSLALFYADYFSRANKSGGAWMDSFVDQSGPARHEAGRLQRRELHEAGARPAGAADASTTSRRCSTSSATRCTACSRT